jgi:hypothetical protein
LAAFAGSPVSIIATDDDGMMPLPRALQNAEVSGM